MIGGITGRPDFRHLKAGDPIVFSSESCLIERRPGMRCGLCREACPAGVLSGSEWSIALEADGCIGCGLCAAACPTGAIMVEGCPPYAQEAAGDRIVLECRRVAAADRDPNAVVVPCLGGLTTSDLLGLIEKTEAEIILADRGWCAACPVGRCSEPWQPALDETGALLAAINVQLADDLTVERDELPASRAEPVMAALRPDKNVGRRDFLRRLVTPVESRDPLAESRRVVFGRGLVEPLKRRRILDHIRALAADLEQDIPAKLMPAIKLADGCELNGLCAAICPTGALRRNENDGTLSLQFDATECIACGECQRVCPNKALNLWPAGDGAMLNGPTTLVERRTAMCVSCSDSFVPAGDEQCCLFCQKSMNFMHEIASLKSGSTVSDDGTGTRGLEARAQGGRTWARLI